MYGKNPITKPFRKPDGSLLVHDVWETIQGEGPDVGCPAIFLRLSKCLLKCWYCDTEFDTGNWYSVMEILKKILDLSRGTISLLVITGGEPCLQNLIPLVSACNIAGMRVAIESAGVTWDSAMDYMFKRDRSVCGNGLVISPKTPKLNEAAVAAACALKYIIGVGDCDDTDGLPIKSSQIKGNNARLYRRHSWDNIPIYVQPLDVGDPTQNEANVQLAAATAIKYNYRLSLQTHKITGLP